VSFGNLTVGSSTAQPVTLTDVGTANISISAVSVTGGGFSATGGLNVTLTPNQSVTVNVNFDPTGAGAAQGSLSISSNATNSLVQLGLSGTGVAEVVTHKVALNWQPSASKVIGYFVYRGSAANNLSKLIGSVDPSPSYTDTSVSGGQTYVYAVTSVDSSNVESAPSSPISVTIPNN
jgi:fibronectin type 3 domain-containing protein